MEYKRGILHYEYWVNRVYLDRDRVNYSFNELSEYSVTVLFMNTVISGHGFRVYSSDPASFLWGVRKPRERLKQMFQVHLKTFLSY